MKKFVLFLIILSCVLGQIVCAETSSKKGKPAIAARLNVGKNGEDPVAQLAAGVEYGVLPHFVLGAGYVYVDGIDPLQQHGIDLSLKGFLFERPLDVYAAVGSQLYLSDGIGAVFTLKAGLEWQSPFGLFFAGEGGAEVEGSEWGYLFGLRVGYRL